MDFQSGKVYHVYNRGNRQEQVFFDKANYLFFLKKMRVELLPHSKLLAYCLMPNHFHWLLYVKEDSHTVDHAGALSKRIAILLRSYTRAIQNQQQFTGSLFQQKTKARLIKNDERLITCANYIHQNPMKAKLVEKIEEWDYSSFKDHCMMRNGTLCDKTYLLQKAGMDVKDFYRLSYGKISKEEVEMIS